jgi:cytochrome bd-type quinol oxidase subunit 2
MRAFADLTHASKVMGRLLIGLVVFLMMAMMWTERFMTWDKFLQGGQDLELSLVALVVFLCLIILLAQQAQQAVAFEMAVCLFLFCISELTRSLRGRSLPERLSPVRNTTADETTSWTFSGTGLSPLRI